MTKSVIQHEPCPGGFCMSDITTLQTDLKTLSISLSLITFH